MVGKKSIFGSIGGKQEKDNFVTEEYWERKALVGIALSVIDEQKKARRWGIFFKLALLAYVCVIFVMFAFPMGQISTADARSSHIAVIDVKGVISAGAYANSEDIIDSLVRAFENKNSTAIVLRIDSPGGSPVQSGYVYDEIMRLKEKYKDKKVYAVAEDICASGAYYIAAAADEIYADKASVVGSIGVRMGGFGFVEGMKKLGIERRLITAGENKGFMDPFSPQTEKAVEHSKEIVAKVHEQFKDAVRNGRGERLKEDQNTFTGLVWTGEQGVEMGLVDQLGSVKKLTRDILKQENVVNYSPRKSLVDNLAQKFGVAVQEVIQEIGQSVSY